MRRAKPRPQGPIGNELGANPLLPQRNNAKFTNLNNRFHSAILVNLHVRVLCQHNDGGFLTQDGKLVVTHVSSQYIRAIRFLVTREGVIFSVKCVHMRASKDHRSTWKENTASVYLYFFLSL